MSEIQVVVHGALGKMGRTMCEGLAREEGIYIVGAVDAAANEDMLPVPGAGYDAPLTTAIEPMLAQVKADVLVDFSRADASLPAVESAAAKGLRFVVGTTGLSAGDISRMAALSKEHGVGGVVASNFAVGAVLLMHLSELASPYFDYAEIVETHHETKIDAPSGTAAATARLMSQAKGKPFQRNVPERETVAGTRAGEIDGVTIHSLRLPGTMAHQEVIFGTAGQTLTLRHDTINRECYVPGVVMAVRHVVNNKGFVQGLDVLMGL